MLKKLIVLLLLLLVPFLIHFSTPSLFLKQAIRKGLEALPPTIPAQVTEREGKEAEEDAYSIRILKQVREKVDIWLKSLNERIEREDATRLAVRFYEFIRNILEWAMEKLDAKIKSSEEAKPPERKKGKLQETKPEDQEFVNPLKEILGE